MIADSLKILGYHQHICCLLADCRILSDHLDEFLLYFVEQFIHDADNGAEVAAAVDKGLIVSGGAGDVEIVAPAPVEFRVHPVQGKGNDGQNVGRQGAFLPGGVNFAGRHVFDVIREADGDVGRGSGGRPQVNGDLLGNEGNDGGCRHGGTS